MISAGAKFYNLFVKVIKPKRWLNFDKPKRTHSSALPREIENKFKVEYQTVMNRMVATICPPNGTKTHHIIFMHGGGYVFQANPMYWKMINRIISIFNCKLTYIDYPLSPEHTYVQTTAMTEASIKLIARKYPNEKLIFLGDSAGGGLALVMAQKLVNDNATEKPFKLVLFSPWTDLNMENPAYAQFEKLDDVLDLTLIKKAALMYAGGDDINQPLISPANGNFNDLPPSIVFFSKHELLYPNCEMLKTKVKNTNTHFEFKEYENMQHAWVLLPIRESQQAIQEAFDFVMKDV